MWLVANQRELTIEGSLAQCLGRAQAGKRGANDGDSAQHGSTSLFDRNRSRRTLSHSSVHFRAQTLFWRLVQDVQCAVVANLEHLRRCLHAEPVEIANAEIYNDLHVISLVCDATDLWITWPGLVLLPLCLLFLFLHLLLLVLFLVFLATLVSHASSLSAIIFPRTIICSCIQTHRHVSAIAR